MTDQSLPAAAAPRPSRYSPDEWDARVRLAAAYRIFDYLGWGELIYNHISLRVPDQPRCLLLNRFGLHYSEVRASNLVKVDLDGRVLAPAGAPVNAAGIAPHTAIHGAIADAHCVMHTHTTAGMAVACSAEGLSISNFYAAQLGGRLAYHDFEGITVHADEGPRLVHDIGLDDPRPAVILRNHGLLAWGRTVPTAFYTLWALQRACEVQVACAALGPVVEIPEDIQRRCAEDARRVATGEDIGRDAFDAMVRLVDRRDRSWRD
jgi:ribulose-5-phosphate 4-epimerase/fuculose-1-phosphate aldolase